MKSGVLSYQFDTIRKFNGPFPETIRGNHRLFTKGTNEFPSSREGASSYAQTIVSHLHSNLLRGVSARKDHISASKAYLVPKGSLLDDLGLTYRAEWRIGMLQ